MRQGKDTPFMDHWYSTHQEENEHVEHMWSTLLSHMVLKHCLICAVFNRSMTVYTVSHSVIASGVYNLGKEKGLS